MKQEKISLCNTVQNFHPSDCSNVPVKQLLNLSSIAPSKDTERLDTGQLCVTESYMTHER